MTRLVISLTLAAALSGAAALAQGAPAAVSAWVAAPAAGATSAAAYVELGNPTMYDVYIVSATAEGAGAVELRGATPAGGEAPLVKELTIPAYGSTEAKAGGPHLRLVQLAKPLKAGDSVPLTLTTEAGIVLKVTATVREP